MLFIYKMHIDDLLWHISIDSIMLKTNGSKLFHEHGIRARIWNLKKTLPLKQIKFKQFISSPMDECWMIKYGWKIWYIHPIYGWNFQRMGRIWIPNKHKHVIWQFTFLKDITIGLVFMKGKFNLRLYQVNVKLWTWTFCFQIPLTSNTQMVFITC
jgi:hypothetical protein